MTLRLTFSAVLTWALLEFGLIVLDPILFRGFYQYDPELGFRVRAYANGANEFGFNDIDRPHRKPPGVTRVLALGDSFHWPGGRDCSYPALLGQRLRPSGHEVVNAGYPSTGTPEEFGILKRFGMTYEPDVVLLSFFVGNDFHDSSPWRKRVIVNGIQVDIDPREEVTLFGYPIVPGSRILRIVRNYQVLMRDLEIQEEIPVGASCGYLEGPTFSEEAFQQIALTKLDFMRRAAAPNPALVDHVARTLREMKGYLVERGARLQVVIIPDELQVDAAVLERSLSAGGLRGEDLELDRPQRLIREILDVERIPYLDLLPVFRQAAKTTRLFIPRDTHWNRAGAELAADHVSIWLKPAPIVH